MARQVAVQPKTRHSDSRLPLVLDAAARLFREQGFRGTSIRDIAQATGMLPGSLYCHFATKDDLLIAVYAKGVAQISAAIDAAVARHTDPWDRLEAAATAHLGAILLNDDYAQVIVRVAPGDAPGASRRLTELRDAYELKLGKLVDELPLPRATDRRLLRLMLLGALNWSQTWYRAEGTLTPRIIARRFISLIRQSGKADA